MSNNTINGQCPHCGSRSPQAFLSGATPAVAVFNPDAPVEPQVLANHIEQRLICSGCEKTWEATIVPKAQMEKLLAAVNSLDDARRQIAMMRLIMSKDQLQRAERSREDIIKIRSAA